MMSKVGEYPAGAAACAAVLFCCLSAGRLPAQTDGQADGWTVSTPEEQGVDSGRLADALVRIQERRIRIDSLLIARNGCLILDASFYPYDSSGVHDLASVTKSVTTTLVGIAADRGMLQLDAPVLSFFPDRRIANRDSRKERITVRHLAGMVNGFDSGADEPTLDRMRAAPDWIQSALDRRMVRSPGAGFQYDSPGMHLLSAILQQATGMTELEFARRFLFEPIGIRDVIWDSDPQGYTRGWGDLHLTPRDAARLGQLWLNGGVWDGRQVVPAAWVTDAVKPWNRAGRDWYGYGWWVSRGTWWAYGRGGQYIKVDPAFNAVVVVTGDGLEYDEISPLLVAAVVDRRGALPARPEAVARLDAAIRALRQAPAPGPVGALPPIARAVSGRTYACAPNSSRVEGLAISFDGSSEAVLCIRYFGEKEEYCWPVGLDGIFRLSPSGGGMTHGLRGRWTGQDTFALEIDEIGNIGRDLYRLRFAGDTLTVDSPDLGMRFEGRLRQ
jgi:CubicO group peptidase (beta-lactamase class C family)